MIRLPHHSAPFPRIEAAKARPNAWGSQWKHLHPPVNLIRNAMRNGLRKLRG